MMVCAQVIGNAVTVTMANTHGNLDLNVMLPVMARNTLESLTYLDELRTGIQRKGRRAG